MNIYDCHRNKDKANLEILFEGNEGEPSYQLCFNIDMWI